MKKHLLACKPLSIADKVSKILRNFYLIEDSLFQVLVDSEKLSIVIDSKVKRNLECFIFDCQVVTGFNLPPVPKEQHNYILSVDILDSGPFVKALAVQASASFKQRSNEINRIFDNAKMANCKSPF